MKTLKIFAATALAAVFALSCTSQSGVKVDAPQPTSGEVDTVSYLIGINFGSFIKGNGFADDIKEINMDEVMKGMQDFIKSDGSPYDPDFSKQFAIDLDIMNYVFTDFISKKQTYKAAVNDAEGKAVLAKNALKDNVDTTASGLQYTIEAIGAEEKIQPQDTVLVNYKGSLINGEVFDQGDSVSFAVNQVIKGWTEGLSLLGEGGKAKLYIPAELGYGSSAAGKIGPNSTLIFDVEVIKVSKYVPAE